VCSARLRPVSGWLIDARPSPPTGSTPSCGQPPTPPGVLDAIAPRGPNGSARCRPYAKRLVRGRVAYLGDTENDDTSNTSGGATDDTCRDRVPRSCRLQHLVLKGELAFRPSGSCPSGSAPPTATKSRPSAAHRCRTARSQVTRRLPRASCSSRSATAAGPSRSGQTDQVPRRPAVNQWRASSCAAIRRPGSASKPGAVDRRWFRTVGVVGSLLNRPRTDCSWHRAKRITAVV
jgi:hypothetical protein